MISGQASEEPKVCTGLFLNKSCEESNSTDLIFEIDGVFDTAQLESLFDKPLFKVSINADKCLLVHENLYEYTLPELQQVSNYLASLSPEKYTDDDVYKKLSAFRDNGILTEDYAGSDNGVDMKTYSNKDNHWAMDEKNRIALDPSFEEACDV